MTFGGRILCRVPLFPSKKTPKCKSQLYKGKVLHFRRENFNGPLLLEQYVMGASTEGIVETDLVEDDGYR